MQNQIGEGIFAELTKLRIVHDASAKASKSSVFINECFGTASPLQNSSYDILVRSRIRSIILYGDI